MRYQVDIFLISPQKHMLWVRISQCFLLFFLSFFQTDFWIGFSKNLSFKIAISGRVGRLPASSQVYLLVDLF